MRHIPEMWWALKSPEFTFPQKTQTLSRPRNDQGIVYEALKDMQKSVKIQNYPWFTCFFNQTNSNEISALLEIVCFIFLSLSYLFYRTDMSFCNIEICRLGLSLTGER